MLEKMQDVLLEYVDVPRERITPETRFLKDLAMNSLDIMTMVGQLEDETGLTIPTEDLLTIFTVQDMIDYLTGRMR